MVGPVFMLIARRNRNLGSIYFTVLGQGIRKEGELGSRRLEMPSYCFKDISKSRVSL